jgi:hypothetical protein
MSLIATDAQLIEQMRETCKALDYPFFERGDFNLNLHAIRKQSPNGVDFSNTFDDELRLSYKENGVWKLVRTKWTTLAGTLGQGGALNPLTGVQTGTGVDGVAVIKSGFYKSVFRFVDSYTGFLWYPYFDQVGNLDYYRDNDKDLKITKGKTYTANFKTLLHRMSNNNIESDIVNRWDVAWSQGCNGAPEPQFRQLLHPTRQAVKLFANLFSYGIFDETQLVK